MRTHRLAIVALAWLSLLAACETKEPPPRPAQAIAASAIAPPPAPKGPAVLRFTVDPAGKTSIDMPAPKERIKASTTASTGELSVDPNDLTKTTGQVKVDLTTLTTHTFDDEHKDTAQTEHAQNWLEVGKLVTPEVKEANRWVIFTIKSVEGVAVSDLAKVPVTKGDGDVRAVEATVKGDFFLHGHQVPKEAQVTVTFHYASGQADAGKPTRVGIQSKTPLHVLLAEHDVKPRDSKGQIAAAAFALLGTKVADTADINLDLTASPAAAP